MCASSLGNIGDMETQELSIRIGQRVGELREQAGFSKSALADASGLSRQYLTKIEFGNANPTAAALSRIAAALGVTLEELLDGTDC